MRPPGFTFGERELHCDGIALSALAKKFGTPLYVYSATAIRERYRAFERAFRRMPHTICYSVKANSNVSILRLLGKMGAGFDVVSGGELARVLKLGRHAAARTVFSGVGKTAVEIDAGLRARLLLFNLESEGELEMLAARAAHVRVPARIAFRVNPDVPADTHPYISTGLREHKFGIPIAEAPRLYARAARQKWLQAAGISVHIGSQITALEPFDATMRRLAELVRQLRLEDHDIRYVDAGGGLGIPYEPEDAREQRPTRYFENYARALMEPLRGLKLHLLLEPGRSIVGPAGALLTSVLYLKQNGSKRFAVVDAAMTELIRPALYGAYHEIAPAAAHDGTPTEVVDVVGPVCETGDFFARDRRLPLLAQGDLLAILDVGAYGMSLASNYNSRPRPAEVLVDGHSARLIRRREPVHDLFRLER